MTYISISSGNVMLAEEIVRPPIFRRQAVTSKNQQIIVSNDNGYQDGCGSCINGRCAQVARTAYNHVWFGNFSDIILNIQYPVQRARREKRQHALTRYQ